MRELKEKFLFTHSQCDQYGHWLPGDLMTRMQDLGSRHSGYLGASRDELLRKDAVWVLTRNELRVFSQPKAGDLIVASTYPGTVRRTLYPRYHRFETEDGRLVAEGLGGWTLADIHTRRMAHLSEIASLMPDTSDLPRPFGGFPAAVEELPGEGEKSLRELRFCDFDLNGHVNNTKAGEWVCDALGARRLRGFHIEHLVVNYLHEILPGAPLEVSLRTEGPRFSLRFERDGAALLLAGGELARDE